MGSRAQFGCLFSSLGTFRCFLLTERKGLNLKVWPFGVEGTVVCFLSSLGIFRCLLLVKREGLHLRCWSSQLRARLCSVLFTRDLQASPHWKRMSWLEVWIPKVDGTFLCLFSSLGIFNLFYSVLEENVLILNASLLERERLIWERVIVTAQI